VVPLHGKTELSSSNYFWGMSGILDSFNKVFVAVQITTDLIQR
jgi:hypothetical protein